MNLIARENMINLLIARQQMLADVQKRLIAAHAALRLAEADQRYWMAAIAATEAQIARLG
jgi:NADH:ubiquinone oxidoreductase subunit K